MYSIGPHSLQALHSWATNSAHSMDHNAETIIFLMKQTTSKINPITKPTKQHSMISTLQLSNLWQVVQPGL